MFGFWWNLIFVCLLADHSQQKSDFTRGRLLYHKGGNVSLVGIFHDRSGPNCSVEIGRGLEEAASMIWTVEALNRQQYIPGITVGLSIFGACQGLNNRKGFIEAVEEHVRFNEGDNYIGVLTTPEIHRDLPGDFADGNVRHVEHVLSTDILIDATVQLLINLQWMGVKSVVSDSANTLELFKEKASEEGLFVQDELLMNNGGNSCGLAQPERSSPAVVVVAAAFANISSLARKICKGNTTFILTPTDFLFDVSLLDLQLGDALVSLPPIGDKASLLGYITHARRHQDFFSQKPPTKGPLFIGAAASVLKMLKPIKTAIDCQNKHSEQPCADFMDGVPGNKTRLLPQKSMKISPDDVGETLKVLKIEPSPNDEMFLYVTSVINANASEDVAICQIFSFTTKKFQPILIMINDDSLTNGEITRNPDKQIDYLGRDFRANLEETQTASHLQDPVINSLQKLPTDSAESFEEQIDNSSTRGKACEAKDGHACPTPQANATTTAIEVSWRFLTWVSINTSLGFVGVTCTLSAMLFIIIRLCKDDILEGSPCFTLLLMISVIFAYFSSLPFHVEFSRDNHFICSYRKTAPPAVFTILFSLLLSRSLLLAFTDGQFVTHVNGYLQSILCFFMIGVQVSVISQNWITSKDGENCADAYDKYKIIFALGYDFLLLILLACVSPFIIRSKENYKEGLLFSISVFFITVVWSAWISFYVLLPNEHKDAAIAIGLNSTASVLLFCIFIPQTYFMAAPFVQNRTLRSLSPLNGSILRDVNFKSNQALNETAFGSISYKNCEMGVSNPNFLTTRSNTSNNPIARETIIDVSPDTSQPN